MFWKRTLQRWARRRAMPASELPPVGRPSRCDPVSQVAAPLSLLVVEPKRGLQDLIVSELEGDSVLAHAVGTSREATRFLSRWHAELVIANTELPDESAWLMVSKWRVGKDPKHVWLYAAEESGFDSHWAQFTRVEELIYHGDRFLELPRLLVDRLRKRLGVLRFAR